jgi:N-acetylneuraminic acid mutarotase
MLMRLVRVIAPLALIVGIVLLSEPVVSQAGAGNWAEKARLGVMRTEAGVVTVNGRIYVMGGMAGTADSSPLTQEYDPATDRWRERAPMPGPLSHPGAAVLDGRIYVVGGFLKNVHLEAQTAAYEYDVAANTWRSLPPLSSPRGSIGLAALNGRIHAVGGRDVNRKTVDIHEVYDPAKRTWTTLAPLSRARDHAPTIAVNGRIHVIGGRFDTPAENTGMHDVYDPAKNTWTSAAAIPTARSGGSAVLYRGMIVVTGGECDNDKPFVANEGFDVKTARWTMLAPMPGGRHGIQAATDGQAIYVPGGAPVCRTGTSDTLLTFRL